MRYIWEVEGDNASDKKAMGQNDRMTKIPIMKSSSDLDNKELFPLSGSSYQKVWISSDSDTEEEDSIGTDD